MSTSRGSTHRAICVLEPIATPKDRSSLPFMAKITAPACSAALPTIGNRMAAMNTLEMPMEPAASSMEPEMASERMEMNTVMMASQIMELLKPNRSSSSSSSSSSATSDPSFFSPLVDRIMGGTPSSTLGPMRPLVECSPRRWSVFSSYNSLWENSWKYRKAKYNKNRITLVALEKPISPSLDSSKVLLRMVGNRMPMVANMSRDAFI
mmetsp:Transcript_10889/g.19127  ORF Transcript_10889/g.19127 Transcript_10889/m.19127 type:complete len:208 (-) Transcript_10889:519-1142(-)